jgi:hypothetical protein
MLMAGSCCDDKGDQVRDASYQAGNPPGYFARHESGHAAAFLALGIPLDYVTIVGHGSQPRAHTQPVDVAVGTHGQKTLVCASGVITGFEFSGQRLTDAGIAELLTGSADDQFELEGMLSGRITRLARAAFVGRGEDLERISPEVTEGSFTPASAVIFWRDCESFVKSITPAVDAIAEQLVARGRLPGDETTRIAVAAMAGRPAPWIPPWTAEE